MTYTPSVAFFLNYAIPEYSKTPSFRASQYIIPVDGPCKKKLH